jgi:hypothetical protein
MRNDLKARLEKRVQAKQKARLLFSKDITKAAKEVFCKINEMHPELGSKVWYDTVAMPLFSTIFTRIDPNMVLSYSLDSNDRLAVLMFKWSDLTKGYPNSLDISDLMDDLF